MIRGKLEFRLPPHHQGHLQHPATRRVHQWSSQKETLDIIAKAEIDNRDYYTGVFGYTTATTDSAVAIRYIEFTPNGLVCRSGGGITAMSDAQSEYQEMIQKSMSPWVETIGSATAGYKTSATTRPASTIPAGAHYESASHTLSP